MDTLRDSLERVESSRDEWRGRCEGLQDRLTSSIVETEELARKVVEMDKLLDEVSELKQTAAKVAKYEAEVKVYQRKLGQFANVDEKRDKRNILIKRIFL